MAYGLGDVSSAPVIDWPTARDMVYHAPGVVVKMVSFAGGPPQPLVKSDKSPSWVKTAISVLAKAVHGGRYPIVIAGTSYILDNSKPATPPAQGYKWVYSQNTGWIQKKKGGGILGAIGSVLGVVGKVASVAVPVVGPAIGIGTNAIHALTSAGSSASAVGQVLQPASPKPPLVVPAPTSNTSVPIALPVPPAPTMPSWVVPAAIGMAVAVLATGGRRQ